MNSGFVIIFFVLILIKLVLLPIQFKLFKFKLRAFSQMSGRRGYAKVNDTENVEPETTQVNSTTDKELAIMRTRIGLRVIVLTLAIVVGISFLMKIIDFFMILFKSWVI
ncbi:MAG: hypothetical protein ACOCP4_01160 [Candidatus Woesearchaeota archaeon]